MAQVLASRGVELKETNSRERMAKLAADKDPLAHQRETILNIFRMYANNLAFREFLKDFTHFDMGATKKFEELNEISGKISTRMKIMTAIQKEKTSDEAKLAKMSELPVINDEFGEPIPLTDMSAYEKVARRIHTIREKKYVPESGEYRALAEANIAERVRIHGRTKALEGVRNRLKKYSDRHKKLIAEKEKIYEKIINGADSEALQAFEQRRLAMFDELEAYDFRLRDVQEAYLARLLTEGKSLAESFNNLPQELLDLYQETEATSQRYQALLKEGEQIRKSEALNGGFGEEARKLAVELYAAGGLTERLDKVTVMLSRLDYVKMAALLERRDQLMADYIEKVVPEYFKMTQIKVMDELNKEITSLEEARDIFKHVEKALAQWNAKVLTSKPKAGESSLY